MDVDQHATDVQTVLRLCEVEQLSINVLGTYLLTSKLFVIQNAPFIKTTASKPQVVIFSK